MHFLRTFSRHLASFTSGRAPRTEYWLSMVGVIIVSFLLLGFLASLSIYAIAENIYAVAAVSVSISILLSIVIAACWFVAVVRRLHDLNMTAWNLLWFIPLSVIPFIGFGAHLVLGVWPGKEKENRYGHQDASDDNDSENCSRTQSKEPRS